MKCYDFELNISAYIDGELKQAVRSDFLNHEEICRICSEKLQDIEKLLQKPSSDPCEILQWVDDNLKNNKKVVMAAVLALSACMHTNAVLLDPSRSYRPVRSVRRR